MLLEMISITRRIVLDGLWGGLLYADICWYAAVFLREERMTSVSGCVSGG